MSTTPTLKQFRSRSFSTKKFKSSANSTARSGFGSLAQFNKVAQNRNKHKKQIYESGQPIRIQIPAYFNIPQYERLTPAYNRPKIDQNNIQDEVYLTGVDTPQPENNTALPITTKKKIKDLEVMSLAMRRQKNLKQQSRTYYCSAVLYDNLSNHKQAIEQYQKFLRIALFLQDRCSIELVLNSIGISYMNLGDHARAIEYHVKQTELAETNKNRFLGLMNTGLCYETLQNYERALEMYWEAIPELEMSKKRKTYVKEAIMRIYSKAPKRNAAFARAQKLLERQELVTEEDNLVKSYLKMAETEAMKQEYGTSRVNYAKALEHGFLNDQPKKIAQNRELIRQAKLGYAITTAESKMNIYLKTYTDNMNKYRI